MVNQKNQNERFLNNQEFCKSSITSLKALANFLIDVDSYFVPDEDRSNFQSTKRQLLADIEMCIGKIRYMSNYHQMIDYGEDKC